MKHASEPRPIGDKLPWMDRVIASALKAPDWLTEYEIEFSRGALKRLGQREQSLFSQKEMAVAQRIGRKLEVEL